MSKKQKNTALIIGFILVLVVCYKLAISKTIHQKDQFSALSIEKLLFKNAPKQLSLLRQKEVYYDSLLTKYQLDGSSIQNNLLKTLNLFTKQNNIKVISFLEPHSFTQNDILIKTYEFVLEGDYNAINKLIYQLEQKTKFGEIVNLHFEKNKNNRNRKYYLQARISLQTKA